MRVRASDLVREMSQSWSLAGSQDQNISRLQDDYNQSVRKTTELSVKLAESQMEIDRLKNELKAAQNQDDSYHGSLAAGAGSGSSHTRSGSSHTRSGSSHARKAMDGSARGLSPRKFSSRSFSQTSIADPPTSEQDAATIRKLRQQVESLLGEKEVYEASLAAVKSQLEMARVEL